MTGQTKKKRDGYGSVRAVDGRFEDVLARTKKALMEEGFGVITEIDLKAKFKEKLNEDFDNYMILGACSPSLAFEALKEDIALGLLLPCNVVVFEQNGKTSVAAIDAEKMLSVTENARLVPLAATVNERLVRVIEGL